MLGMALYIDNLERLKYDIPLIIRNWRADRIVLFSGGDVTTSILQNHVSENDKLSIIQIDKSINRPTDIPIAFNHCIDYCYDVLGFDSLIFSHADVYITKAGMDFLAEGHDNDKYISLEYDHVQLYSHMWASWSAVILSYKDRRVHWDLTDDGSRIIGPGKLGDKYVHDWYNPDFVLDVGYLTVQAYINKMKNHNFIWPDAYKVVVALALEFDKAAGLQMAYNMIKSYCPLVPIEESRYGELFDYFQCWDEYRMCVDLMKNL